MGARPRYFLLSLALPDSCTRSWLDEFLSGMAQAARQFDLILAGGDTTRYVRVAANLTVVGEAAAGRVVKRSGARPGDVICVSGRLGEAELGLRLLLSGAQRPGSRSKLLRKHLRPEPRLALGQWLARGRRATSMIDISDGLSTDLVHICEASGVGARIWSKKVPTVAIPRKLRWAGGDAFLLALHGGDEYELLFTAPRRLAPRLPPVFSGIPITAIGEITPTKRIVLIDSAGREKAMRTWGWEPFLRRARRA
jgi:thiamine-monophosphate kinase